MMLLGGGSYRFDDGRFNFARAQRRASVFGNKFKDSCTERQWLVRWGIVVGLSMIRRHAPGMHLASWSLTSR
jgi:hypothetical protein